MSAPSAKTIGPPSWPKGWIPPPANESAHAWRILIGYLSISLIAIPFLRYVTVQEIPVAQQMLAYILFCLSTWPVVAHFSKRTPGLPVFPLICLMYAVSLALPVYYSEPVLGTVGKIKFIRVMDQDTTRAVAYSIVGMAALQFGFWFFRFSMLNLFVPCVRLELDPKKGQTLMIFLGIFGILLTMAGMSGRLYHPRYVALFVVFGRVSILSTSFLYVQFLRHKLDGWGRIALISILLLNIGIGLGAGAVRNALDPLLAIGAVHWMEKRRISWKLALVAGLFFLIMQAVKGQFRELVLIESESKQHYGMVDRLKLWQDLTKTVVSRLLVENKSATTTSVRNSFGRMDMIHLFGHAIAETPKFIPFQEGKTYSYFLYMFVPRAIWWNKPTAQMGNEFFGVQYRLQPEDSIGTTSVGLPHIVEAYINFGFFGVLFVMFFLGMLYGSFDRIFNHSEAGAGGIAIYATILFTLVNIETCTSATFGALPQTVLIYAVMLRLARARKAAIL